MTRIINIKEEIAHFFWQTFEKIPSYKELIIYGGRGKTASKFIALLIIYRMLEHEHFDVKDISFEAKSIRERSSLDYMFWKSHFKIPDDILEVIIPDNKVVLPSVRVHKGNYYNEVSFMHAKGQEEMLKGSNPRTVTIGEQKIQQKWGIIRYFELTNFDNWTTDTYESNNSTYTRDGHEHMEIIVEFNTPKPGSKGWWVLSEFLERKKKDPKVEIIKARFDELWPDEQKKFLGEKFLEQANYLKENFYSSYEYIYGGEVPINFESCYPYLSEEKHLGRFNIDDKERINLEKTSPENYEANKKGKWYEKLTQREAIRNTQWKPNFLLVGVDIGLQDATVFNLTELELYPRMKPRMMIGTEIYYHCNRKGIWEENDKSKNFKPKIISDYVGDLLLFLKKIRNKFPFHKIQLNIDKAGPGQTLIDLFLGRDRNVSCNWDLFLVQKRNLQDIYTLPEWLLMETSYSKLEIESRIEFTNELLMNEGIWKTPSKRVFTALKNAIYDHIGRRKDDFKNQILDNDTIDSYEYCFTKSQTRDILEWINEIYN